MRDVRIITTFNHARYAQHNVYLRTYIIDMQILYPLVHMPTHRYYVYAYMAFFLVQSTMLPR